MLDGAESQNYGYGYGTKVDTPTGSSTVYVHGFGTDDSYSHEAYPGGHQAYGYGHIDPYLNHKQGYGYTKPGYGYNSLYDHAAPTMALVSLLLVTWVIMASGLLHME